MKRLVLAAILLLAAPALAQQQQLSPLPPISAPTLSLQVAGVPASLTSAGSFTSQCIIAQYYRSFAAFAALAKVGTLQVQRYIDGSCTYPAGAAVPATALTLTVGGLCPATTFCGTVASNDGMSFGALKVTITDASTSINGVTTLQLLQGAE